MDDDKISKLKEIDLNNDISNYIDEKMNISGLDLEKEMDKLKLIQETGKEIQGIFNKN